MNDAHRQRQLRQAFSRIYRPKTIDPRMELRVRSKLYGKRTGNVEVLTRR